MMQGVTPCYAEMTGLYGTHLDTNQDFVTLRARLETYLTDSRLPESEQSCHRRSSKKWKLILYSALTNYLQEIVFIRDKDRQREEIRKVKRWYWSKVSALPPEVSPVRDLVATPCIHTAHQPKSHTHAISLRRKLDSIPPIESLCPSPSKSRPNPVLPPPSPINLAAIDGLTPSTLTTILLSPDSIVPVDEYTKKKSREATELRRARTVERVKTVRETGGAPDLFLGSTSPLNLTLCDESDSVGSRNMLSRSFQRLSKGKIVSDRDLLDSCAFPRLNLHDSQLNWEVKMTEVRESKRKLAQVSTPCTYDRLKTALMKPRFIEDHLLTADSLPRGGEWLMRNPFSKLQAKSLRKQR